MKTAIVLSGGGGKGAYQIGVWKALRKLNYDIDDSDVEYDNFDLEGGF